MNKKYTKNIKANEIDRKWHLINAKGQILGRLAVEISSLLSGKKKIAYSSNMDIGDFVVVINSEKINVTGKKFEDKKYHHYSGYPGGLKTKTFANVMAGKPEKIIYQAVKGMLPKNRLQDARLKRLKIYKGDKHPHSAQFKK